MGGGCSSPGSHPRDPAGDRTGARHTAAAVGTACQHSARHARHHSAGSDQPTADPRGDVRAHRRVRPSPAAPGAPGTACPVAHDMGAGAKTPGSQAQEHPPWNGDRFRVRTGGGGRGRAFPARADEGECSGDSGGGRGPNPGLHQGAGEPDPASGGHAGHGSCPRPRSPCHQHGAHVRAVGAGRPDQRQRRGTGQGCPRRRGHRTARRRAVRTAGREIPARPAPHQSRVRQHAGFLFRRWGRPVCPGRRSTRGHGPRGGGRTPGLLARLPAAGPARPICSSSATTR